MRQRLSMTLGRAQNDEGCEFAEEARVPEPLRLSKQCLVKHSLDSEFARICRNPIDGMYVIPSASDIYEWFGILFIRRGIFGGGIFRFNLSIPRDFPTTRVLPVVTFDIAIFHPNIDMKTKQLDMQRYFPDGWKRDKHHILNVLLVVQRVFFSLDVDCESCPNAEAAILWKEHKDKFREMTKERVNQSRAQVYDDPKDDDANAIRLTPWDPSVHEPVRERIMMVGGGRQVEASGGWSQSAGSKQRGFSWVDTDRMTYMTEPMSARLDYEPDLRAEQDRVAFGIEKLDLSGVSSDDSPVNTSQPVDSSVSSAFTSSDDSVHPKLERTVGVVAEEKDESKGQITFHADDGESDI